MDSKEEEYILVLGKVHNIGESRAWIEEHGEEIAQLPKLGFAEISIATRRTEEGRWDVYVVALKENCVGCLRQRRCIIETIEEVKERVPNG